MDRIRTDRVTAIGSDGHTIVKHRRTPPLSIPVDIVTRRHRVDRSIQLQGDSPHQGDRRRGTILHVVTADEEVDVDRIARAGPEEGVFAVALEVELGVVEGDVVGVAPDSAAARS